MSKVAEKAGLERTHLYRKLKQLNIRFSRRGDDSARRDRGSARSPSTSAASPTRPRGSAWRRSSSARSASSTATSARVPLYTLRKRSPAPHGLRSTQANVLGVLSVIFWALVIVVTLKYITLIMRADNRGEGGILALTALVSRGIEHHARRRWWLVGFGIFGAAMFYGDGMITPAISVLGAVEGLEVIAPRAASVHRADDAVIIVVLFAIQKRGTARVGALFGPVMVLWFVVLAVLGAIEIAAAAGCAGGVRSRLRGARSSSEPGRSRSSRSAPSCWRSPAPRRSTPTWAISARTPIRRAWLFFVDAGAGAQLFRTGRAGARRPGRDQESVLPAGAAMGADAAA